MNHQILLIIHLLSSTVWIGGHLFIAICVLPKALRSKDCTYLLKIEKMYEPLGMSALVLLIISGVWMAIQFGIDWKLLFSLSTPIVRIIAMKLGLLLTIICLAISAQTRLIPKLKINSRKIVEMAIHIIAVTLISITMLVLGSYIHHG